MIGKIRCTLRCHLRAAAASLHEICRSGWNDLKYLTCVTEPISVIEERGALLTVYAIAKIFFARGEK